MKLEVGIMNYEVGRGKTKETEEAKVTKLQPAETCEIGDN